MTTGDENIRVLQASVDQLFTRLMQIHSDQVTASMDNADERSRAKVQIAEEWVESYSAAKAKAGDR